MGPCLAISCLKGLSRNETRSHIGLGLTGKTNRLTENRSENLEKSIKHINPCPVLATSCLIGFEQILDLDLIRKTFADIVTLHMSLD